MITAADVMPVLVQACPSFAQEWSRLEVDEFHIDEETGARLGYLDAGVSADRLIGLYRAGHVGEVRAGFDAIERLHVEGDAYVRELVVCRLYCPWFGGVQVRASQGRRGRATGS